MRKSERKRQAAIEDYNRRLRELSEAGDRYLSEWIEEAVKQTHTTTPEQGDE